MSFIKKFSVAEKRHWAWVERRRRSRSRGVGMSACISKNILDIFFNSFCIVLVGLRTDSFFKTHLFLSFWNHKLPTNLILWDSKQVLQSRIWRWEDLDTASEGEALQMSHLSQKAFHRSRTRHTLHAGQRLFSISKCYSESCFQKKWSFNKFISRDCAKVDEKPNFWFCK